MIELQKFARSLSRRQVLACAALPAAGALGAGPARAETDGAAAPVRLGILQFGTVQWIADVIQRRGLDSRHGFALRTTTLANTDAGRVALMAGAADVVVSDWPFVATQRAAGTKLVFSPFSLANGGVMVRADSPVHSLGDLRGLRLGVAGGPVDKSWLVMRAAAAKDGVDLDRVAKVAYGAPPLLGGKLQQGDLDAVLTFWNFAAKLEAAGFREAVPVSAASQALGLPARMALVGFVFREDWAEAHRAAIDGFLAAAMEAQTLLAAKNAEAEAEWTKLRPLMEASDDATFERLKARFSAGVPTPADLEPNGQRKTAEKLFALLLQTGGTRATGDLESLPNGIFWRTSPRTSG